MQSIVNLPSSVFRHARWTQPHAAAAADLLQQPNRLQLVAGSGTSTRHSQVWWCPWTEDGTVRALPTGRKEVSSDQRGGPRARAGLSFFLPAPVLPGSFLCARLRCTHASSPPAAVSFPMRRYGVPISVGCGSTETGTVIQPHSFVGCVPLRKQRRWRYLF